jgi:hypothetical protein
MQTIRIAVKTFIPLVVVLLCSGTPAQAQADPTVEIPTAGTGRAIVEIPTAGGSGVVRDLTGSNVAMGGEYKASKNIIEQEKPVFWNWAADIGYTSEYNFRGTNLTPDADGAGFIAAEVSKWNFTLGVYGIHQFGEGHVNSWSIGEGGGGGSSTFDLSKKFPGFPPGLVVFSPETTQSRFNEIDLFINYRFGLGPIDVTVGNIAFFIDRRARTIETFSIDFGPPFGSFDFSFRVPTLQNEQFDRVFVRLSTSKIPYITPQITYYQTVYTDASDPGVVPLFFGLPIKEHNYALGGYLEGKLLGNFPITGWLNVRPYGVISYSFHDRTEPIENPTTAKELVRGKTLSDFNAAQVGLELPIRLVHMVGTSSGPYAPPDVGVYFVPFGAYSYHISDPTPGTDRDEWWGGAKFTVTF